MGNELKADVVSRFGVPAHTGTYRAPRRPSGRSDELVLDNNYRSRFLDGCFTTTQASHDTGVWQLKGGFEKRRAGTEHPWADLRSRCGMATGAATIAPVWASQDFWTLAGAVRQWLCKTAAGRSVAEGLCRTSHRQQPSKDAQNYTLEQPGSPP